MDDGGDAVAQWLRSRGEISEGGEITSKKKAAMRFRCEKLTGGCVLFGEACARRHQFAKARMAKKKHPSDSHIYWAHRDDSKCAVCPDGAARARLLGIGPDRWKKDYKASKRRRHLASIEMAKANAEREKENDVQGDIDWPIDCRPRRKDWE